MLETVRYLSTYLFPSLKHNENRNSQLEFIPKRIWIQHSFSRAREFLWKAVGYSTRRTCSLTARITTLFAKQVIIPFVKTGAETILSGTANKLACIATYAGVGSIQKVKKLEDIKDFNLETIAARRDEPLPSDSQIKEEVEKFGNYFTWLVSMKLIDQVLCRNVKSEDFYFEILVKCKSDEELKQAFFHHLDRPEVFFPARWTAKISYYLFFPFIKKIFQDATISIFEKLQSYLYGNANKQFNELFNHLITKCNNLLVDWIIAIEKIENDEKNHGIESVHEVLKKELAQPKYYAEIPAGEFYDKVTKKAVSKYCPNISLGEMIYQRLTGILIFSSKNGSSSFFEKAVSSLFNFLNSTAQLLLFPLALATRLALLLPDYLFNRTFSCLIRKAMISNRVLENILKKALEGISTNKGLSVPALKALNATLEETLVEEMQNKVPENEPVVDKILSKNNQDALRRNVRLFLSAADLYSYTTIAELRDRVRQTLDTHFIENTKGIEYVIILASQKMKDCNLIKKKLYFLLKELNNSFTTPRKGEDEKNEEFLLLENDLFSLIKAILEQAIIKKVSEKSFGFFLKKGQAAHNWVVHQVEKEVGILFKKIFNMISSPDFLKYQLNVALSSFLKEE